MEQHKVTAGVVGHRWWVELGRCPVRACVLCAWCSPFVPSVMTCKRPFAWALVVWSVRGLLPLLCLGACPLPRTGRTKPSTVTKTHHRIIATIYDTILAPLYAIVYLYIAHGIRFPTVIYIYTICIIATVLMLCVWGLAAIWVCTELCKCYILDFFYNIPLSGF